MKILNITVSDRVVITNKENIGSGNVNTVKCVFSFGENWTSLEKRARFEKDGIVIKSTIIDNECCVPSKILETQGVVCIGVYGYEIQGEEVILRESPVCSEFIIRKGSYRPIGSDTEEVEDEVIESTDYERYIASMNEIKNTTEGYKEETFQYQTETQKLKDETLSIKEDIVSLKKDYDNNAISKTNDFNTNVTNKTDEFDTNATNKKTEFNQNADNKTSEINVIAEGVKNFATAIQFATFEVTDEMELVINTTENLGNVSFYYEEETGELEVEITNG